MSEGTRQSVRKQQCSSTFAGRSTPDVIRSWVVFRMCEFRPIIKNAGWILDTLYTIAGTRLTTLLVKVGIYADVVLY